MELMGFDYLSTVATSTQVLSDLKNVVLDIAGTQLHRLARQPRRIRRSTIKIVYLNLALYYNF